MASGLSTHQNHGLYCSPKCKPLHKTTEKPKKYYGVNFKEWQQMMPFWLTKLEMQMFISIDPHIPKK